MTEDQSIIPTAAAPIAPQRSLVEQWEDHLDLLANTEEYSADTVRVYKSGLRQFRKWWERRGAEFRRPS